MVAPQCLHMEWEKPAGETDVSKTGWGAYCQSLLTGGRWSAEEVMHINELELLAVLFALKVCLKERSQMKVLLKSDNISTVTYINHLRVQGCKHW